jgi:hypothetical protein
MPRFKVLAVNDDKDFCECCGKSNLKKVVWIKDVETGEIQHFGSTCAVRNFKGSFEKIEREIFSATKRTKRDLENMAYSTAEKLYETGGNGYVPFMVINDEPRGRKPENETAWLESMEKAKLIVQGFLSE